MVVGEQDRERLRAAQADAEPECGEREQRRLRNERHEEVRRAGDEERGRQHAGFAQTPRRAVHPEPHDERGDRVNSPSPLPMAEALSPIERPYTGNRT
jgi:predicted nucleic acid-binding Zn ribbon protein